MVFDSLHLRLGLLLLFGFRSARELLAPEPHSNLLEIDFVFSPAFLLHASCERDPSLQQRELSQIYQLNRRSSRESLEGDDLGRIEQLWITEAKRRRDEVRVGKVETVPGEESCGRCVTPFGDEICTAVANLITGSCGSKTESLTS